MAGGLVLAAWAWWSGSQSELARNLRDTDGPLWWLAAAAMLVLTLAVSRC